MWGRPGGVGREGVGWDGSGQWAVASGPWALGSGQWAEGCDELQGNARRHGVTSRLGTMRYGECGVNATRCCMAPLNAARGGTDALYHAVGYN